MSYTPTNWANGKAPALNATNLNKIEDELVKLDKIVSVPDITEATETTMPNSYDGRFLVKKIKGVCQQGENPSPTSTQEIKKSVVSVVKTHGKNHVKNVATSLTANGITFTVNNDGSVTVNGTATANAILVLDNTINERLKIGDTYKLTGCPEGGKTTTYRIDCVRPGVTTYMLDSGGGSQRHTVTEDTINATVRIWIGSGVTVSNLVFKPMVCNVNVEDYTYEPYKESSITLSQPIDLYGIGDVQDVITPKQVKRRFAEVVFDGSDDENWRVTVINDGVNYRLSIDIFRGVIKNVFSNSEKPNILCEQFSSVTPTQTYTGVEGITVNTIGTIYVYSEKFNTNDVSLWKAHLQSNPMTVVYELAEEVIEELPIADQIALNSLATYDGVTYLEFDSEVQPTFEGEYGTSKVGGYTLEALLTARSK